MKWLDDFSYGKEAAGRIRSGHADPGRRRSLLHEPARPAGRGRRGAVRTIAAPLAQLAEWNYLFGEHQKALRDVVLEDDPDARDELVAAPPGHVDEDRSDPGRADGSFSVTEEGQRLYGRAADARQGFLEPNTRVLDLLAQGPMEDANALLHGALTEAGNEYLRGAPGHDGEQGGGGRRHGRREQRGLPHRPQPPPAPRSCWAPC